LSVTPGSMALSTDQNGRYSISGLATGVYTVAVTAAEGCGIGLTKAAPVTPGYTATADFVLRCGPRVPAVGEIIITEFGQNSAAEDQWIELYNTTSDPIDVAGLMMDINGRWLCTIADLFNIGSTTIAPHSARAISALQRIVGLPTLWCGTEEGAVIESIVLLTPGGNTIDAVFAQLGGFPAVAPGNTLSLDPTAYDAHANDSGANWCLATQSTGPVLGSPNEINPTCPGTIRAARNAPNGTAVDLTGTVTGSFASGGRFKSYIQDRTGGIALYPTTELALGRIVRVTGTRVTASTAEVQIDITAVTDLGIETGTSARRVGAIEVGNGSAEGELVWVAGIVTATDGRLLTLALADGPVTILLAVGMDVLPVGTPLQAVGVVERDFTSRRIRVRGPFDLTLSP